MIDHCHLSLARRGKGRQQVRPETHIAPPPVESRISLCWGRVFQGDALQLHSVLEGRIKESRKKCGFKRQNQLPIGAGAFREKQQFVPYHQPFFENRDLRGRLFAVAHNENRACGPR